MCVEASAAQVAIAWLLHKPTVASVVIGARNAAQLNDNLQAANLRLSQEEVRTIIMKNTHTFWSVFAVAILLLAFVHSMLFGVFCAIFDITSTVYEFFIIYSVGYS